MLLMTTTGVPDRPTDELLWTRNIGLSFGRPPVAEMCMFGIPFPSVLLTEPIGMFLRLVLSIPEMVSASAWCDRALQLTIIMLLSMPPLLVSCMLTRAWPLIVTLRGRQFRQPNISIEFGLGMMTLQPFLMLDEMFARAFPITIAVLMTDLLVLVATWFSMASS